MTESNNKIRVCFVSPKAYPLFNPEVESVFGGAEVDLYLIATELANDERFDVRFVVGDYGQANEEIREGVTLYKSADMHRGNLFSQGPKVWGALKRADADVYMHEACSLGTTLVALFCKLKKRAFVYRTASCREANGDYQKEKPIRGKMVAWGFKQARFLLTQNETDAANLQNTLRLDSIVVRNTCRVPDYPIEKGETILWAGRSLRVKRPDLFIKLARQLPELSFVMICPQGTGDADYDQLVSEAESVSNLTFIKRVPFQNIDRYFEEASIFVNTSDTEGFPNTFVQACKSRTAILSLNVNPDGFLNQYQCGLSAEGDWDRFGEQLDQLRQGSLAAEYGEHGLSYVQTMHDIRHIIKTYKEIFVQAAE